MSDWTEPAPLPDVFESGDPCGGVHALAVKGPVIATSSSMGTTCIRDFRTLCLPAGNAWDEGAGASEEPTSKFWSYRQR